MKMQVLGLVVVIQPYSKTSRSCFRMNLLFPFKHQSLIANKITNPMIGPDQLSVAAVTSNPGGNGSQMMIKIA